MSRARIIAGAVLAGVLATGAAGCNAPPTSGTVVNKSYDPGGAGNGQPWCSLTIESHPGDPSVSVDVPCGHAFNVTRIGSHWQA